MRIGRQQTAANELEEQTLSSILAAVCCLNNCRMSYVAADGSPNVHSLLLLPFEYKRIDSMHDNTCIYACMHIYAHICMRIKSRYDKIRSYYHDI